MFHCGYSFLRIHCGYILVAVVLCVFAMGICGCVVLIPRIPVEHLMSLKNTGFKTLNAEKNRNLKIQNKESRGRIHKEILSLRQKIVSALRFGLS